MLAVCRPISRISLATKYVCDAIGDSLTENNTYLSGENAYYPFLTAASLQALGCSVAMVNSGHSGDTTGDVLVRSRLLPSALSGSLGVLFCGTNDLNNPSTVQASPSPTTTVFAVAAGKGQYFPANTNLMVNGVAVGRIASVSTDTLTLTTPMAGAPTAGQAVTQDTSQNIVDAANVMIASGYSKLMVGIHPYLNWTVSGDTLAAQQALALTTRTAQRAAITTLGATVVIADFYAWMRNLIVTGVDVQGSFSWHVADLNVHPNDYGCQIYRDCLVSVITAQGWLPSLRI